MALGDWKTTEGKQRAVWVQPGCNVADEFGLLSPADVIIIESGVACVRYDDSGSPSHLGKTVCLFENVQPSYAYLLRVDEAAGIDQPSFFSFSFSTTF